MGIVFLICALALPANSFTRPHIIRYHVTWDHEDELADWLKRHNEIEEVFIHPEPNVDVLKKNHWEKLPYTINKKEIWIRRKPHSDKRSA